MESDSETERLRPFLPIGYTFCPSDYDLVRHYLYKKIAKKPLSCYESIKECNLYGSLEPWEIWNTFGGPLLELEHHDEDLFFFTHLKKINSKGKGSRFCRKVGSGTWQGEDAAKPIFNCHSQHWIIGWKKRFRYEKISDHDHHHGSWIMHEYLLDSSLLLPDQTNDYVLCRLRKNHVGLKRKMLTETTEASGSHHQKLNNKRRKNLAEAEGKVASTSNSEAASISNSQLTGASHHTGLRKINNNQKKRKMLPKPADAEASSASNSNCEPTIIQQQYHQLTEDDYPQLTEDDYTFAFEIEHFLSEPVEDFEQYPQLTENDYIFASEIEHFLSEPLDDFEQILFNN